MRKKLILPLLIGLALIITGCTIPIIKKEVRMPWEKKPAEVIKQAMANAMNVKSSHYQGTFKIGVEAGSLLSFQNVLPNLNATKVLGVEIDKVLPEVTANANSNTNTNKAVNTAPANVNTGLSLPQKINLTVTASGDTDFTDAKNGKMTANFNISLGFGNISFTVDGESRSVNKIFYLKINNIPNIPFLNQAGSSQLLSTLQGIAGTWLKIDPQEIQKSFLTSSATPLSNQVMLNVNQQEDTYKQFTDLLGKLQPKFKSSLANASIYSYQSLLTSEKINGVECYHYKVALDKEGFKQFIIQFIKIYNTEAKGSTIQGLPTNNSINESDLNKQVDSLFKYFNTNTGEVWIGQKDFMTYKMLWHFVMKNPDDKNGSQVKIDFVSTFSDINTPKSISEPTGAKSIIDVYTELMAKATGKTTAEIQAQQRDSQRLSDISHLKTALLLYADDHTMKYSKTLDELVPDYISSIPKNPTPGGVDYTYEPSQDLKFYQLSFVLEVGTSGYGPGLHIQTQEGIDKGKDTDSDGLTDDQENYFGTDVNKADTDGDGYNDGDEVKNGFNPNGTGNLELNNYKLGE